MVQKRRFHKVTDKICGVILIATSGLMYAVELLADRIWWSTKQEWQVPLPNVSLSEGWFGALLFLLGLGLLINGFLKERRKPDETTEDPKGPVIL